MDEQTTSVTRTPTEGRQGEVILRRRWQRLVFFGGLFAVVGLVAGLRLAGIW